MNGDATARIAGQTNRSSLRRFLRHKLAVVGAIVLLAVILLAVLAPLVTRKDPYAVDLGAVLVPPNSEYWLGTDRSGRDVWSRVVYGARTSLIVGFGAVGLYVLIGTAVGAIAGYVGRSLDAITMRVVDIFMSVPALLLVIVFVTAVGPSLGSIVMVIGLLGWPGAARLVRGQVLSLREREFVLATHVLGIPHSRILVRHILPNVASSLVVLATFGIASAIILEAGLSFLGLGVQPPEPSWGEMINAAQSPAILIDAPWLWVAPGLAIAITVLSVNFVGDGLREVLDPQSETRR